MLLTQLIRCCSIVWIIRSISLAVVFFLLSSLRCMHIFASLFLCLLLFSSSLNTWYMCFSNELADRLAPDVKLKWNSMISSYKFTHFLWIHERIKLMNDYVQRGKNVCYMVCFMLCAEFDGMPSEKHNRKVLRLNTKARIKATIKMIEYSCIHRLFFYLHELISSSKFNGQKILSFRLTGRLKQMPKKKEKKKQ